MSVVPTAVNTTPGAWLERRVLSGPTLLLTPLVPENDHEFLAALGDPATARDVTAHLTYGPPRDLAEARRVIHQIADADDRVVYAQRLRSTGEMIGVTAFYEIVPEVRALGIGHTWIGRRFWRTGVNTASKLIMMSRAFDELGAERVVWHTDIRNLRSQAAIERLGAVKEGILRHHRIRPDGSWRDTVQYSMLSHEWARAQQRLRASVAVEGLTVVRQNDRARYEGRLGQDLVATIDFVLHGSTVVITHTGTDPQWRGRGFATQLTGCALDDIRARGERVSPLCPYTASFVAAHPTYADLLV